MQFTYLLGHQTERGPVFIAQAQDGRYYPMWKERDLGNYETIRMAIDDVAGGHTFSTSDGTDLGSLGISDDPSDWVPASLLR